MAEAIKEAAGEAKAATAAAETKAEGSVTAAAEPEIPEHIKAYVAKTIQSETDKVRTKYVKEKEALTLQLEEEKKSKMTAEEKLRFETEKARTEVENERRQVQVAKLEMYATKALATEGLDTDAISHVMADSEEAIMKNIASLKAMIAKATKKTAEDILKGSGRTVQQTFANAGTLYTEAQIHSFTEEQIREIISTPEGRKRLDDSRGFHRGH